MLGIGQHCVQPMWMQGLRRTLILLLLLLSCYQAFAKLFLLPGEGGCTVGRDVSECGNTVEGSASGEGP